MRFWDTSAVVPLCVAEPLTRQLRQLLDEDPVVAVWWATRTECLSAFARRRREGGLERAQEDAARRVLAALSEVWSEVLPGERLREVAERFLRFHPLRAADAFQLAAAVIWSRDRTAGHAFVACDERLRDAASRQGFAVLP